MFDPWSSATELYLDFSNYSFFRSKKNPSFEQLDENRPKFKEFQKRSRREKNITMYFTFLAISLVFHLSPSSLKSIS